MLSDWCGWLRIPSLAAGSFCQILAPASMNRLLPRLPIILFLLVVALPSRAEDPFQELGKAVRMTNYSGVMVYSQGERMETLRIVHRYADGMESERLRALSGEPVEFLRNGGSITCIVPRDREVQVDMRKFAGLFPALPAEAPQAFRTGLYRAVEKGNVTMLGRSCRHVHIQPMDEYRYGYRLWVDAQTGLPLKYQMLTSDGRALEQAMFTEISFPETIDDAELAPTLASEGFVQKKHEPMPERTLQPGAWEASTLPAGFMLMQREVKYMPEAMGEVEHLVYSDGLASVSVYVAAGDSGLEPFMGITAMGATHAFGTMLGEHHIGVMGEVPQRTVELIGSGMRRVVQ